MHIQLDGLNTVIPELKIEPYLPETVSAGQGKSGCKNIRLGGDTVSSSEGAHMCYMVHRSVKHKPV